jgi:hypothetical protein
MASRVAIGHLESQHHPKESHGVYAVFPSLWRGGRSPHGLGIRIAQSKGYDEDANQRAREDSLDQLDEARDVAMMHSARYRQTLRRYQAQKVRR